MTDPVLNTLCSALRDVCAEAPLQPKWLLVPTRRVGFQWLDAVARSGQPVLLVRLVTVRQLALELAAPALARRGLAPLGGAASLVLMDGVVARLRGTGAGYLSNLPPTPGLLDAVSRSLRDLRLAGVVSSQLDDRLFEVSAKGRDVRALLESYEAGLAEESAVDDADVLRLATERLRGEPGAIAGDMQILIPEDGDPTALERWLLQALPAAQVRGLPVDGPAEGASPLSDTERLAWIGTPAHAPAPLGDGSVELVRAVGEAAEVREVLRRCIGGGIPMDQVEVLHTDAETYGPLWYELAASIGSGDRLPITFAEGIPTRFSRPGRALMAWIQWARGGYPQSHLVRMVQDGLLRRPEADGPRQGHVRLGKLLRSVPIGAGRERYLPALDAALRGAIRQRAELEQGGDTSSRHGDLRSVESKRAGLAVLRSLVSGLLEVTPDTGAGQAGVLEGAHSFLAHLARSTNELDQYAAVRLRDEIRGMREALPGGRALAGLDVGDWLADLAGATRVAGQGPRPGCLYVAPLLQGGHSGRAHTFIVGLDETRFPGAGMQDPVLLDGERAALSDELPTAARRQARKERDLAHTLARLRGRVTLSYSCRVLTDDREMMPSPAFLSAFRIVTGRRQGDLEDLLAWMPPPSSFAPDDPGRCVDSTEWWLWRVCGDASTDGSDQDEPEMVIGAHFPHLARGFRARDARAGNRFTEYDGYVPAAGAEADPTQPGGPVISASRLELLGRCPLDYFFRYLLDLRPPEEVEVDPDVWLDPPTRGKLLHDVFRQFVQQLVDDNQRPVAARDSDLLMGVLAAQLEQLSQKLPPPNEDLRRRVVAELEQTARIFLQEEERHCRDREPVALEVAIGMKSVGEGTFLDTPDPVPVRLPDGSVIRARGQIDRVDRVQTARGDEYELWDYKTGSTWGYDPADPFRGGRRVQNALYRAMADLQLARVVGPRARVARFGYFFPSVRAHGERVSWAGDELDGGGRVIGLLTELLRKGAFPMADDPGDLTFSDYVAAHGDVTQTTEDIARKLDDLENAALTPLRRLRRGDDDGE